MDQNMLKLNGNKTQILILPGNKRNDFNSLTWVARVAKWLCARTLVWKVAGSNPGSGPNWKTFLVHPAVNGYLLALTCMIRG